MTQDEQDALVGRLTREFQDAEKNVAALRARAGEIGRLYINVGNASIKQPERLTFVGESFDSRFAGSSFDPTHLGFAELKQIVNDLRTEILRSIDLDARLTGMGIKLRT
jgi:hypothetical protein